MARFATRTPLITTAPLMGVAPRYQAPVARPTNEGGAGFAYTDPHTELFLAAVSGLLKDQFYESADTRVARIVDLVAKCDPEWLRGFMPWLRDVAHLRSAPIVIAAEYVKAGFPDARHTVASVLKRPDEPGEILAYWRARHGRSLPMALKRGVADAVTRLYNERAVIRWDGQGKTWRFGDVINTVHPKPAGPRQSDLFRYCLDRRRNNVDVPESLVELATDARLLDLPENERTLDMVPRSWGWERIAGWIPGGMTAAAWEAAIPNMGYMALIRNLRNFDQAGVSDSVKHAVAGRIADLDEVAKSKQLPFRFLNAYLNAPSDRWKWPLTQALEASVGNLPALIGRTLIMVDCSGSMGYESARGGASRSQTAALFAWSIARRCDDAVIAAYDNQIQGAFTEAQKVDSVLAASTNPAFAPKGGTATWACTATVNRDLGPFDRIVILTDEQAHDTDQGINVPVITWNLAGYDTAHAAHGKHNRYTVGGYSDTVLSCLPAVLDLGSGKWPWQ